MAACFKVATKFRILYFIMLNKEIWSADCFILGRPVATAEGTGFGLQKQTGPSSEVVASIVLIIIVCLQ